MATALHRIEANDVALSLDAFRQDIVDGLSGLKSGVWGKWRYDYLPEGGPASGGHFWENLAEHGKQYDVSRKGDQALDESHGFIQASIGNAPDWIVDLGIGVLRPAKCRLLAAFGRNAGYMPVDVSGHFLEQNFALAEEGIVREVVPSQADFTQAPLGEGLSGKKLFLFLGSNLGNLPGAPGTDPTVEAVKLLKQIRQSMGAGDRLLIVNDGNQNGQQVLECYNDELAHPFMLSVMHKAKLDLSPKGNFNAAAWKMQLEWCAATSQCSHMAVATEDQAFAIGDRAFIVPKGARYTASNSYKFTPESLAVLLQEAGFKTAMHKSGRMVVGMGVR